MVCSPWGWLIRLPTSLMRQLFRATVKRVVDVQWLSEAEARAWRSWQRLHTELTTALARELAEDSGLSYPDYEVLVALTDQADGRLRQYELGQRLGWEKSRLSH